MLVTNNNNNIDAVNYSSFIINKFSRFCIDLGKASPRVVFTLLASQVVPLAMASDMKKRSIEIAAKWLLLYLSVPCLAVGGFLALIAIFSIHCYYSQGCLNDNKDILLILSAPFLFAGLSSMAIWALLQIGVEGN